MFHEWFSPTDVLDILLLSTCPAPISPGLQTPGTLPQRQKLTKLPGCPPLPQPLHGANRKFNVKCTHTSRSNIDRSGGNVSPSREKKVYNFHLETAKCLLARCANTIAHTGSRSALRRLRRLLNSLRWDFRFLPIVGRRQVKSRPRAGSKSAARGIKRVAQA